MAIRVSCDDCGQALKVADDLAGRRVKCKCGAKIDVPAADDQDADELAELTPLPPRRSSASRKPRGKSSAGLRLSVSPRLFKNLFFVALAAVVCVIGVYAVQWGMGIATMASSMKKISELKKSTMAVIDSSGDRIRKNRDAVEGMLRNPRAIPSADAVQPLLDQLAADTKAVLDSLAAIPTPEGLVDGGEFVGGWRDSIRIQSELLTTGIPPLVELRNDESRDAAERVLEVQIALAEIRIKDCEALMAMLARHLEFYKKNKTGMSPGEVELRLKIKTMLEGAQDEQRRLAIQRKKPAAAQAPAQVAAASPPPGPPAGAPARTPADGSDSGPRPPPGMDVTKPETWGETPVPTVEIKSLEGLKRGMKIWVHTILWEPCEILGPGDNDSIVYRFIRAEGKSWVERKHPSPYLRIEKSELQRADLKDVPLFAADTKITADQVREKNGEPPPNSPFRFGRRGGPRGGRRGGMRGESPEGQNP